MNFYKYSTINVFSLRFPEIFSLANFIGRMQYIVCRTYEISVNRLFVLLVRVLVNCKVLGCQKLYANFQLHRVGREGTLTLCAN